MVESRDSLDGAADVVRARGGVQVFDGGVLRVAAEDLLAFCFSGGRVRCGTMEVGWEAWNGKGFLLVRFIDIINSDNSQVSIIPKVAQRRATPGLQTEFLDLVQVQIQADGHAEETAIGKAEVFDDSDFIILLSSRSL